MIYKGEYYDICRIPKRLRGWKYIYSQTEENVVARDYCPLCKLWVQLVSIGMMNTIIKKTDKLIEWPRCEQCLVKLPIPPDIYWMLQKSSKSQSSQGQQVMDKFVKK